MSATLTWNKLEPSADPQHHQPLPRSSHGLSTVQKASRLILYGGENIARTPMEAEQQTWAVDLSSDGSSNWRWIDSSKGPPARVAHAQAAYDDKIVYVFGGRAGITMQEKAMNDLWKLDCSGPAGTETWEQVQGGGTLPEERSFHKMLCIGSSLYVFGGCSANHGRLADIYKFDISTNTWENLGTSSFLKGRGGANFLPLNSGSKLGVIAGFCGEESNDGHMLDVASGKWEETALTPLLQGLRPRSVCVSGSFPSTGLSVIFGGEVDPSAKGHEGAGGFENDVTVLDEKSGKYLGTTPSQANWPETRGWSDSVSVDGNGVGHFYVFGGLTGDDDAPKRLDDLWRLDVEPASA